MASNKKIKGLTVQIGADTSNFNKAMEESNKKSRSLKSELSEVERLLKLDPTNVELVAQKQKILTEQVEESSKRLDILKQAQDEVNQKFKSGEIGEETYRNFQREVIKAENDLQKQKEALDKVKKSADNTDTALSDASKEAENLAKKDMSETKKELDDVKQSASDLKDVFKDTIAEASAIGGTLVAGAATAIGSANDNVKATNNLQALTGLSSDEVKEYKELIESVYKNNFGEDQENVAEAIALIKQNLNDLDDTKLQDVVENLFTLEDTFGFDYTETLRAAKMLIDQFGISADEAFNLIVQGAQNGLNKNGDLLDSINEYSVHYKQQGYSAEEFFNSLENGTAAGTFSVDKLGDAMKEFGIRTKDTATTTQEGFELIGLDADTMRSKFAAGGESARQATDEVLQALFDMDDQVAQNQAGVDLFGTMWEDLGIDGVKALMDVKGSADKTKTSMQDIKDIKYSDIESDWESLGRTIKTDIISPIGKDLYPTAKKAISWTSEHLDDLEIIIEGLAKQVAIVWGAKKARELTTGITNLIGTYKTLTTATNIATTAQEGLNTAQALNVIGVITTLVIGLISAVQTYNELEWSNSEAGKFCAELDEAKEKLEETTQGITDTLKNTLDSINNLYTDNTLIDDYQAKLDELLGKATLTPEEQSQLQTIVTYFKDNIDGFEDTWDRYVEISDGGKVNLKGDLGEIRTEINKTIDDYQKLANQSALSELQTENAKAKITANKNTAEIKSEMESKYSEIKSTQTKLDDFLKKRNITQKALENYYYGGGAKNDAFYKEGIELLETLQDESEAYDDLQDKYNESVGEINKLIMTNDDLIDVQKVLNGDYSDAAAVLMAYNQQMISQNDILSATDENGKILWASMDKLKEAATESGKNTVLGLVEGTKDYQGALAENSQGWAEIIISEYETGMDMHSPSKEMHKRGVYTVQGLINGLQSKNGEVGNSGRNIAQRAKNGTSGISLFQTGVNFVRGFINGISDGSILDNVKNAAITMGNKAISAVKKVLGINSPSKEAKKLGGFFAEGLSIGIDGKQYKVKRSSESMAQAMLDSLDFNNNEQAIKIATQNFRKANDFQGEITNNIELKSVASKLDELISIIKNLPDPKLYLDSNLLVGATTKKYDNSLADLSTKKKRGW
ncbi:phage tail tape measure protein [Ruminococcus sp.]|jgi:phage-related minor tail protein|uniref:phage tail tape measure protein n=1 Tax=Ruminococcus sp. TaxID=41978 RepID=UPI0025F3D5E9|nr:phage tail tape measure protein [Ruminococcus sp.]